MTICSVYPIEIITWEWGAIQILPIPCTPTYRGCTVYICCLHVMKSKQVSNGRINLLPKTIWGNQTLLFFNLMLNKLNERTNKDREAVFICV